MGRDLPAAFFGGGTEWALILQDRRWSIEQAAAMLEALRLPVAPVELERWTRPGLPDGERLHARAYLFALLGALDAGGGRVSRYFSPSEFGKWFDRMNPGLLAGLDVLREEFGAPVEISAAGGSLGRHLERDGSLHNVDLQGQVYAADVLIPAGMDVDDAFERAIGLRVFSGVGVYPDWKPRAGLHVDMRHLAPVNPTPARTPRNPATWGAWRDGRGAQVYGSAAEAIRLRQGASGGR